ncbi:MAG: hypothetical protein ACK5WM_04590, partial [Rhodospirillales bacterium]
AAREKQRQEALGLAGRAEWLENEGDPIRQEWVREGADFLWRRSKLGLHLAPDARAAVEAWFAGGPARAAG